MTFLNFLPASHGYHRRVVKYDEILKGEIEIDELYFEGGGGLYDYRIRILDREAIVSVTIVKDEKTESFIREPMKQVGRGSIVYNEQVMGIWLSQILWIQTCKYRSFIQIKVRDLSGGHAIEGLAAMVV